LLNQGRAEEVLEKAKNNIQNYCILLQVSNEDLGLAQCEEYAHRPLVCRCFGVAGRFSKKGEVELSVCKKLKELYPANDLNSIEEVPIINLVRSKLEAIDPILTGPQFRINEALVFILEKVLLWDSYQR
jgi:Fe-S-cluster containining protein